MTLSVLIPTYNRSSFLIKNLEELSSYIKKSEYFNDVEIVISNNFSIDDTDFAIRKFIKCNPELSINYYSQDNNIGLEKNALFVLQKARYEYIMFLGDDDFIEFNYFLRVMNHIKHNLDTSAIIPSFVSVDISGVKIRNGRDIGMSTKYFQSGFKNCLENSWRGHQLSGLVLKREGLYDAYIKYQVQNIYLFIFFLSFSCLNGDTYHLTEFPVKVTDPGQNKKDWNYASDGLLLEIFDNYINLPLNSFQIALLQFRFIHKQPWRLWGKKRLGLDNFSSTFKKLLFSDKTSLVFKLFFPFFVLGRMVYRKSQILLKSRS